jgi:hypothetical protein
LELPDFLPGFRLPIDELFTTGDQSGSECNLCIGEGQRETSLSPPA